MVPFAFVHAVPQAPQFAVLVPRSTSQPFATLRSQLALPAEQVHVPPPHVPPGQSAPDPAGAVPHALLLQAATRHGFAGAAHCPTLVQPTQAAVAAAQ